MRRLIVFLCFGASIFAQALGNAGTIDGSVTDPSGAVLPNATVTILNRITNYQQTATTDSTGAFRLTNIPPNSYHMEVAASSFAKYEQDVDVRSTVPVSLKVALMVAGARQTVTVESKGADLLENVPYAHNDVDISSLSKLLVSSPASGVSDAVVLSSGAVAADSNGFFHPLGDHAQTSFSVDGQPISDQQSKAFSTQIPLDAVQSMELITGAPSAEFGDKTSLVVNAVTRSGLGQMPNGSFEAQRASFGTYAENATFGAGTGKVGDFIAFNSLRSGRFLDTPEFTPIHAIGNSGTIFDHFDYNPNGRDVFHLNVLGARNWFQIPNTYDQLGQDQRQKIATFNIAPGYQHIFSASTLLTMNPFLRQDHVNYYPSPNITADTPATISQHRTLTNWGVKADLSIVTGRHNFKVGTQLMQTRLHEQFGFGITDPTDSAFQDANGSFLPGLTPYVLTSVAGTLFRFDQSANINQYAFYAQDNIKFGNFQVQAGLRVDVYHGLVSDSSAQPRAGFSYLFKQTGAVVRASYSRTFETPYNENLILSSATGVGGLASNAFGAVSEPLPPGTRNQYNAGLEQSFGRWLVASADYFWKYTDNAYDFGVLFNTPIAFPISWNKSKLDGVAVRIGSIDLHGFQWTTTMGHARARYFPPETGGLVFNGDVGLGGSVFRIDHDQAFQQNTELRYQKGKTGPWISWTWRYDSGLVAGSVGSLDDALGLTGAQQAAIGFFCGSSHPTIESPLTDAQCTETNYGATRLLIPASGTENDDHNPPRIAPRHVFDIGVGTDNLFHREHYRTTLRFAVTNFTNKDALYNFLSTFSGTHFIQPRAYQTAIGLVF
jgi:Carboxypeptidase regulatory-like domain